MNTIVLTLLYVPNIIFVSMRSNFFYLFAPCLLYCCCAWMVPPQNATKWVLIHGGSLKVDGSTNVNKFSCEIVNYSKPDTLFLAKSSTGNNAITLKGMLTLDVLSFNCHNPMMTSDLRKTLKAKDYPYLHIRFQSLNKMPDLTNKQEQIKGWVEIELAGITKQYEVAYTFYIDEQKIIRLIGSRMVTFSDFNLIPPRKLGGMIQAKDQLAVEFQLYLKSIN